MERTVLIILIVTLQMPKLFAQDCEYQEYFNWIELARQDYNGENYKEANEKYKRAFSATAFPLGTDLAVALRVAKKRKDAPWAETIAIQLAKGGIPLEYFSGLRDFKWYAKFEADFPLYIKYHTEHFNTVQKKALLDVRAIDLEWNKKFHSWRVRYTEMTEQELINGFGGVLEAFVRYCEQYGFPTEKALGYYYDNKQIAEYPTNVLLTHIYQGGVLLYLDDLDSLVCKGFITPGYATTLKSIRGFGNSTGVEQEVKARIKKFRGPKD